MKSFIVIWSAFLVSMGVAFADSGSNAVGTTSATSDSVSGLRLDDFYASFFSIFHGAPMSDLNNRHSVDNTGRVGKKPFQDINFDSELTLAYKVTPTIGVGPVLPFLYVPVEGQGLVAGDFGLKLFDHALVSNGPLWISANIILQAPTSDSSQARNMAVGIKSTPAIRYQLTGTRFSVGAWTELKEYAGVTAGKTFKLLALPYVSYQLVRSLALNVGYEFEAHHDVGNVAGILNTYQTDWQPGFVWLITPKLIFNPYVEFNTTPTPASTNYDRASLGATISASLL